MCSLDFITNISLNSDKESLEAWAIVLNSPWANNTFTYLIKMVSEDEYICDFHVIAYDLLEALIYGYGETPEEALANCKRAMDWAQINYNSGGIKG